MFNENGRKLSKRIENTLEKKRNCSLRAISLFFRSVFKRPFLQIRKNQGLFGKGSRAKSVHVITVWAMVDNPVTP